MNKVAFLGLISLLLVSCGVVNQSPSVLLDLDEIGPPDRIVSGSVEGTVYTAASAETPDSTLSTIDFMYYTPQFSSNLMDSTYKDSVNQLIYRLTLGETMGGESAFGYQHLTESFFAARMDSFVVEAQREADYLESMPWSMEIGFQLEEHKTYVKLEYSGWTYTGGAHGNFWSSFYLLDKRTGHVLELIDFVSDVEILEQIALPYFREQNEVPDGVTLEEHGFWFEGDKLELNENFYFTEDSIVFFFNIYEIAPYSGGAVEVKIPVSVLGELYMGMD